MQEEQLSRAQLLIVQNRYTEAEEILINILGTDPNNTLCLQLLSECLLEQDKNNEALDFINKAIGIEADNDELFSTKARILIHTNKLKEAESNIIKAIEIDPEDADHHSLLGWIALHRKDFDNALHAANQSLSLDPENMLGLNVRSKAQQKLGHKDAAFETIQEALNEDPNNAFTHTNFGWSLLEQGKHEEALEHFKQALSIDPNFGYAQTGMGEAIKARYGFYRLFLKYSFWMSNMTSKYQWGVIIGFYILFRIVTSVAKNNPDWSPFMTPLIILMFILAFSTWIIHPISNLFLRLNKYGTHLLSEKEKMSSNFVGISLAVCLFGFVGYFSSGMTDSWLGLGCLGFAMMVPLGSMFTETRIKNFLVYYTIGLAAVGTLAASKAFYTNELFNTYSTIFLFGFIAYQWVANFAQVRNE